MNSTETRAYVSAQAVAQVGNAMEAAGISVVWFDANSFAFQLSDGNGGFRWVKYVGTVANDKATSRAPAFDPYAVKAQNEQARAEAAAKAAQKKAESDAKRARDEGKRAKAKAKAKAEAQTEPAPAGSVSGAMIRRMIERCDTEGM